MVTNRARFLVPRCFLRTASIIIFNLLLSIYAQADDFTARHLGDYGNVTVMEASGSFDELLPDGTENSVARQKIAREFFRTHKDEYDFVAIFTNFDYQMKPDRVAYYSQVKNDVAGIGQDIFDQSSLYGSNGKLQGTIDMGNLLKLTTSPLDAKFEFVVDTLSHEMLHRFGAYAKFKDWSGNTSDALLGSEKAHWSFLLDSGASTHLGNYWQDNGNGTFTSMAARKYYYSPLDLYLMGMIPKEQVPPMLLIENSAIDPARKPEAGVTISGIPHKVTIDDIIAAMGERVPSAKDSPKQFKLAFILAVSPGSFKGDEVDSLETLRNSFLTRQSILSDGKMLVQVASTPKGDLPANPGVRPPTTVPRILPPNVDDGVKWLATHQMTDGSWTDFALTTELDTAEAVTTLQTFPVARQQFLAGLQWLGSSASANSDFLARRLEATIQAGGDGSALQSELLARRNPDGGWGSGRNFISNPTDTALALKALLRGGYGDTQVIGSIVAYLQANQKADGGWSGDDTVSTILPTATVLVAFNSCRKSYPLENSINRAIAFLSGKQNPDGGFGNSPSTVYDSAVAIMALQATGADKEIVSRGGTYLNGLQTEDGSWQESPFQTALAVRAVWQTTVDPDLAIKSADISFIPEKVTSLPTNAVVNAVIWNLGRTDVAQAKVTIYDGAIAPEKKVGEQTVAFPGMSPVTVTFSVPVTDGKGHTFYIVADPDNLVKEANENNNSAAKALMPEVTYDFEVLASDLAVLPNQADMNQEVRISAKIANRGTMSAYNVPVRFFIDEPGASFDIATVTLDIPAGGAVVKEITWKANKAGVNLPLTVQVDPNNTFAEISKTNNTVAIPITVNSLTLSAPNLTITYKDVVITPNPANERGSVAISATVRNIGNTDATNIKVNFYRGIPGKDGILIGTKMLAALPPSGSETVAVEWSGINEAGTKIIYVSVDPDNSIKELVEDDNDAYGTLYVRGLPDVAVSASSIVLAPAAPKEGDVVSIGVTVQNRSEQDATNVMVRLREGNAVVGAVVIPAITGNSTGTATFTYDTSGRSGVHELTAIIDPDNLIVEQSKDNNSATKIFGVQNAKLWVSEPYFSPNGDGIKDTTQISFRLDMPKTVKVVFLDAQGQIVRTFKDGELVNSSGAVVTWDGRIEDGGVAKDGQYQVQISDLNGAMIGSVAVVVDNNRSPMKEALLSNDLFKNDIGCKSPGLTGTRRNFWLDDESAYVVGNPAKMWFFPMNGAEPFWKSANDEWFRSAFDRPVNKSNLSYYSVTQMYYWDPSTVQYGFYAWDNERYYETNYYYYYLGWGSYPSINGIVWSDDRTKLGFYGAQPSWSSSNYASSSLSVIDMSGPGNNLHNIGSFGYTYSYSTGLKSYKLAWSPDSLKLAYWDPNTYKVIISDPVGGNKSTVYSATDLLDVKWIDNDRLLVNRAADNGTTILVNTNDKTASVLAKGGTSPTLSNARTKFLIKSSNLESKVVALDGTVITKISSQAYGTPVWSVKDRYVMLQQTVATDYVTIVVYDLQTNEYHTIDRVWTNSAVWYDENSLLFSKYDNGVALYDLTTRTTQILDPTTRSRISISPYNNYLLWGGPYNSSCSNFATYLVSPRANLSAAVRAATKGQSLVISGTATDANFGGWKLEYADRSAPDTWNLVAPPSDVPVIEGTFTSWVPPGEGIYEIRLTAWDNAGNSAIARETVTWSNRTGISNIYKNLDAISPNGDNVNDSLEVHYSLPAPVHVDFSVYDSGGALVKSGYASPGSEYVSWDGRDETGRIVPDGKYKVKVFDFELYFNVDNEPPVTSAALSPITRDMSSGLWRADLTILANDSNLKIWKVEYGEGENPSEWLVFREGTKIIAKKDQNGNQVSPMSGDTIATFYGDDIGWLKGKKFRITAEDFAGNKSSATTDFIEEKIFLSSWDHAATPIDDNILPEMAKPGTHFIGGAETFRLPVASNVLQYWNGREWLDVVIAAQTDMGKLNFAWDSTFSGGGEGFAIRAKVQDSLGGVHYSNVLSTKSLFTLEAACSLQLQGQNSLFEALSLLKLQARAPGSQWTDIKTYDSSKGDVMPTGLFYENGPNPIPGSEIRMSGVGGSGKTYETSPAAYPPNCPVKFKLFVSYEEAKECGEVNPGRVTLSGQLSESEGSVVFQTLSYYIQKPAGLELLKSYDVSREGLKSHLLITTGISEGVYPVKAVLSYLDRNDLKVKVAEAVASVTVDRSLPVAVISQPQSSLQSTCPVKYSGASGDWYGIPVEGTVADNVQVKKFDLFYGVGEKPVAWLVAGGSTGQPITGVSPKAGTIGVWNVSSLQGATNSLRLKVVDEAGNISCATTSVSSDKIVDLPAISLGRTLFSPNKDGVSDDLNINFFLNESALFDAKVFRLLDYGMLDTIPVRTVASGMKHFPGSENLLWDGKADGGVAVPDGRYGIAVSVRDACSNSMTKWAPVEVDVTPPIAAITYPKPGDDLPSGNAIEVKGVATDANFQDFMLEAGKGDIPTVWFTIGSGSMPVSGNILGRWNTFGLDGKWTLRVTATDKAGNKSGVTSSVDLVIKSNLIKSVALSPTTFSPNADMKKDTATITYELTTSCQTDISIVDPKGLVIKTISQPSVSAGTYSYIWDGKNNSGATVPDGYYKVKVHAVLLSDNAVTQTEEMTVYVDNTPPAINISTPATDGIYLNLSVLDITGVISDENLTEYNLKVTGPSGVLLQRNGAQNRTSYTFGTLNELSENTYSLIADAKDAAENASSLTRVFTIDRTPPIVTLDAPKNGDYFGQTRSLINFTGSVVEKNLEKYSLKIGSGENPGEWKVLAEGASIPSLSSLPALKTGKDDGMSDGVYTIWLYAKDKAALEGEARAKIVVDNTPPEVAITSIGNGDYIKGPVDIMGTAFDINYDKGLLELAEGDCSTAFKWTPLKVLLSPLKNGLIYSWKFLPSDGAYCLRLSSQDKVGGKAIVSVPVKVHVQPPPPPVLSGKIESKTTATLNWTGSSEPGIAGYNIYRNGQKLNSALVSAATYSDTALKEGTYAYSVKAVDTAANESAFSNEITLNVDVTGPTVRISSPLEGGRVTGIVDIKGTAFSDSNFKQYTLYMGQGISPSSWSPFKSSTVPFPSGTLGQLDTHSLVEGTYSIKLEAEDTYGNTSIQKLSLVVDKTPPAPPVLLSATAVTSNVSVVWRLGSETDIAGYLLMRNGQLVNGSGMSFSDVTPFLLSSASYNETLPDGSYEYLLSAVDTAGNISGLSNKLSVYIDSRPPHASIVDPASNIKFEGKILLKASSPDNDIVSLQFQYKNTQDPGWTNAGSPLADGKLETLFDPNSYGLTYGNYQLRAVATDGGGKTDPSPVSITVTYTDLTAPKCPSGLHQVTNGNTVSLSWNMNAEADFAGYNVYRTSGTTKTKINSTIYNSNTYQDVTLAEGVYNYQVTAVDTFANESVASNVVVTRIYSPVLMAPSSLVSQPSISINGNNAEPNASVDLVRETTAGQTSAGKAIADALGSFVFDNFTLLPGENRLMVKATDSAGNISKSSAVVNVIYAMPPSVPTGFVASVQDYSVNLTWNPNSEADLAGYNLYRDGQKLNISMPEISGVATASSNYFPPSRAFDGDPNTAWGPDYSYWTFIPAWWEVDLYSSELISRLEINWQVAGYAGKDFEVQLWVGSGWITVAKVVGNTAIKNIVDIKPSLRTNKIRISISDVNSSSYYKKVAISEVKIFKDNFVTSAFYEDLNLHDGNYGYKLAAVNVWGVESVPSEVKAAVGDVTPPAIPTGLTASVVGSSVRLAWLQNNDPDLAGYNVYKNTASGWKKLNSVLIAGITLSDDNLRNGEYVYKLTAVDKIGNESAPSDVITVVVSIVVPPAPVNLKVVSIPTGKALQLSWEGSGGTTTGYELYRGVAAGGPYLKVKTLPLGSTSYLDDTVANGTRYWYVLAGLDTLGNASAFSNEANGMPADIVPPKIPIIFYPVTGGGSLTVTDGTAVVAGSAEGGITVSLSTNDKVIASTTASNADLVGPRNNSIYGFNHAVSPDGKFLCFYDWWNYLVVKNLATGVNTSVSTSNRSQPAWSPDGKKIVYVDSDKVMVYEMETGVRYRLTSDDAASEGDPSWSSDGTKVIFFSTRGGSQDAWIKEIVIGTMTQVTVGLSIRYPKFSPSGKIVTYFNNRIVSAIDLDTGAVVTIDNNASPNSLSWRRDGEELLYVSYDGNHHLYRTPRDSFAQRREVVSSPSDIVATWSPDSQSIAYVSTGTYANLVIADDNGQTRLVAMQEYGLNWVQWLASGDLYFNTNYSVKKVTPMGTFTFTGIKLDVGENKVAATAVDYSGNVSEKSGSISIYYDPVLMPDLAVSSEDFNFYPVIAKPGASVSGTVTIRNPRKNQVENVLVEVYLWDTAGALNLVKSETIARLEAESEEAITFSFNAGINTGTQSIIAIIDPANVISELDETNNYATREMYVTDKNGISIVPVVSPDQYGAMDDAAVTVKIYNNGSATDGTLTVGIEDLSGVSVALIDSSEITAEFGAMSSSYSWNTGATFAGSYRLHAVFTATDGTVTESSTPFAILPDIRIESGIFTDKQAYGANDSVAMTLNLKNNGSNFLVPQLKTRVRIVDSLNATMFADEKTVRNLFPAMESSLAVQWNTGLNPPGDYRVVVETYLDDKLVSSSLARFVINPVSKVSGTVTADPAVVLIGSNLKAAFKVANSGNMETSGSIKAVIVRPESGEVLAAAEQPVTLAMNSSQAGEFTFSTQGLELKQYLISLLYLSQGGQKNIAGTSFTVKDGTPPTVTVVSPLAGTSYNATIPIAALASDNASGMERVEYQLDGGIWMVLPLSDPVKGRYTAAWEPTIGDDGPHTVSFRAVDRAGNVSIAVPTEFDVQMDSTPPVLSVSTLSSGAHTNNSILNIAGTVTDNVGVQGVTVKDTSVAVNSDGTFSYALLLKDGDNTVTTIATDLAGNQSTDTRTITLDQTSPNLKITAPSDNSKTGNTLLTVTGEVNETSTVQVKLGDNIQTASMDGNYYSATVSLASGSNTIEVTATDLADNHSSQKRTVLYDDQKPSVAITDPEQDIKTNKSSLIIKGKASDPMTAVSVTITMDDQVYSPPVINGAFEQAVTFTAEKSYTIVATAKNEVDTSTSVQRNVIYDNTFSAAVFGTDSVTMSGTTILDSYTGNPASYTKGQYKNGDVGTNSLQVCAIKLSGGAEVFGKAWAGPGGDPSAVICTNGGSAVDGNNIGSLARAKDMTPKTDPGGGTSIGALQLSSATKTLSTGDYRVTSINLNGGSTLNLNGKITLHVDGNMTLSGGAKIVVSSGPVTIYANGREVDISGGSIVNDSQDPANFTLYGTGGCQSVHLSGGADLYALVFAPNAAITFSGGGNAFGSIIGKSVALTGGSSVHYYEKLLNH